MEELEEKIKKFHENIDEWISGHNINYGMDNSFELTQRVGKIMRFTEDDIKKLSNTDCQAAMFTLNKYVIYTSSVVAREKAVKQWTEQGIWYIITGQKHDQYAKWEEKYHSAIRSSKSGLKLQMLKTTADARILAGEATIKGLENAIKILENIGRSKSYERS